MAARSPPRLRRCRSVRPELAGMGAAPQRWARAASVRSRSGLSPAVVEQLPGDVGADAEQGAEPVGRCGRRRGAAVCRPGRSRRSSAGPGRRSRAARPWWPWTGSVRRVSSTVSAAQAADQRGARAGRPGRRAACSGAEVIRPWSWLSAAVRALTAPRRATRSARIASTGPVRVFGVPAACPDRAARAAAIASIGSDLPLARRVLRSGRSTSTTVDASARPGTGPGRRRRCRCPRPRP